MKTISLLFFISIFMNSVFGDEVKSVSVKEGDSVTLHTDFTDTQTDDVTVLWTFGSQKSTIAKINSEPKGNKISIYDDVLDGRFRDRLKLNDQTGDLTITNIRTQHTGVYEVEITVRSKIIQNSFNVNGVSNPESDQLKSVSVKDGDSVTLHTDVPDIKKYDVIQWRFKGIRIAHFNKSASEISEDVRFRDKLQLDVQTGSLKIKNIRTDLSGLYEVEISSTSSSYTIHLSFTVTVSGEVKSVSAMKGDPLIIYTDVPDIKTYDQILLIFGNDDKRIADVNKLNEQFTLYGRIRDGLKLNDQTGDLTITEIRTEDAGLYELKMSSRRRTIQRRFSVIISEQGLSPGAVVGISVIFLLLAAGGAAAGVIYYRRKKAKSKHQLDELKPLQADEEESKLLQMDEKESKLLQMDEEESKLLHGDEEESKPLQAHEEESKPSQSDEEESKLLQMDEKESKLLQGDEEESKPLQAHEEESKLLQMDEKESKLLQMDEEESKPLQAHEEESKPLQADEEESKPLQMNEEESKPLQAHKEESKSLQMDEEESKPLQAHEGESVNLKTDTDIQRDDVIEWRFNKTLIAEINPAHNIFSTYDGDDDLFRDKLKLNHQTGDLNINDIKREYTGVYKLKIIGGGKTSYKKFKVSVRDEIKPLQVNKGESVDLKTKVKNIKNDDLIEWRFGETLIAVFNPANTTLITSYTDISLFKNKLRLNRKTGDLTIIKISEEHSGVYILKIIIGGKTSYKRFRVSVTASKKGDSVRKIGGNSVGKGEDSVIQMENQPLLPVSSSDLPPV